MSLFDRKYYKKFENSLGIILSNIITMFKRPLPTNRETTNVATHDEANARYVFIIALV
jgi:hypothetical protein